MNNFLQHIPSYFEGCTAKSFDFEKEEELVKFLKETNYGNKEGTWFAISDNYIMEVSDHGYSWWVCGKVRSTIGIHFPQWVAKERRVRAPSHSYNPSEVSIKIGGREFAGFSNETIWELKDK